MDFTPSSEFRPPSTLATTFHGIPRMKRSRNTRRVVLSSIPAIQTAIVSSLLALRLHVRDLRAEDADLVIDAGGVWHSIQLLRPRNGSIPQALNQFFCFLKLLDKIKMPIQFRQSHVCRPFPSLLCFFPSPDCGFLCAFRCTRSTAIITPDAKHGRCSWTQIYFLDLAAAVRTAKPAGQFINPRHRNTPYLGN